MEPLGVGDPASVGGFVLRGRLGAGGMGRVFLGRSLAGRAVAVKVVHPHYAQQAEFRLRFRQEVTAARAVSGAFTAPVVAAGPDDDLPWLATVYVPGPNLAEAVAAGGPLSEASLWPLMAGLVEALQAIHAAAIVHRDLKPSNVLLAADGPRVIDFGIARAIDATALTAAGAVIGTAGFMPPEQALGRQVGPAGDVFTLGAVVAFAATGSGPFGEGRGEVLLYRIVSAEPRLDGVPGALRDLVAACLNKDPAERPTLAGLARAIADRWTPHEEFPAAVPWPDAVTRLIQSRQAPAPKVPAVAVGPGEAATHHPPAEHATAAPPPTTFTAAVSDQFARRDNAASRIGKDGNPAEAARLFAELALDYARVAGPDYPGTLHCRYKHAHFVEKTGDLVQAARLLADVAVDYARVLGSDHSITLDSRHDHAILVGETGDPAQAARLMADVAAGRARVLGWHHLDTLRSLQRHAAYVGKAGDPARAAQLMADVCARIRGFGRDHPGVLSCRYWQAIFVGDAGDPAKAARLMAHLVSDHTRVQGPDHPGTLDVRFQYARLTGEAGNPAEAARLMTGVAADCARVLGTGHPDTRKHRDHLAYWQKQAAQR